jgi:hypothetical protein
MKCKCGKYPCPECGHCKCDEWIKWKEESLPPPGERVLIAYESGYVGAINFFNSKEDKENYIRGMKWNKENPTADLGIIGNMIRDLDCDPIVAWMMCPKAPKWSGEINGMD